MRGFGGRSRGFGGHGPAWSDASYGGGRGGRSVRGRMLSSDELRLLLLSLIGTRACHGYELIRAIEHMSHGHYAPSPGVVYPALAMLVDLGHVVAEAPMAGRKSFVISPSGQSEVTARARELEMLRTRLGAAAETDWERHAPVRRALDNLKMVLRNAASATDETGAHDIASIIDEAARTIERRQP